MKILALEFSAADRSVAIASRHAGRIEIIAAANESSREVTGMALIDRALQLSQTVAAEISAIVLGLGPGSYTGIRSAIAIAQGWQLARSVTTLGLSSVDALAAVARQSGLRGEISFIVDAQRGDVYHQRCLLSEDSTITIVPLQLIPRSSVPLNSQVVGPSASQFVPGALDLNPTASALAMLIGTGAEGPAENLAPIYLREAAFVKAPPSRVIP